MDMKQGIRGLQMQMQREMQSRQTDRQQPDGLVGRYLVITQKVGRG